MSHFRVLNFILFFIFISFNLSAQSATLKGKITDAQDNSAIVGAGVMLKNVKDTLQKRGATTNLKGEFNISDVKNGNYELIVRYLGYKSFKLSVNLNQSDTNLGTLKLIPDSASMQEVEIEAHIVPMKQNGDTIEYNANAFKTDPDAELEDLLMRLPGITVDNGVKAQGEDIQQILVDNRPYFGGKLDAALKNIPAETIDRIQVYYKPSDLSKFTGFDDGQSIKVINIITKPDKRNGEFGKLYAGYATSGQHNANGDLNLFDGNRRITFIGSSANTTGAQGGVSSTNTAGVNYGDSMGKKVFLSGSYAYTNSHNSVQSSLTRAYFASNPANETYKETDASGSFNQGQTLNLRMECKFDTMDLLTISPAFSLSSGNNFSSTSAENDVNAEPQSITNNNTNGSTGVQSANINMLYGHRFAKKGRTLSVNINGGVNNNINGGTLMANDRYPGTTDSVVVLNQNNDQLNYGFNVSPTLNYTEPLSKTSMLQFDYSHSFSTSKTNKQTSNYDSLTRLYDNIDSTLSNGYYTVTNLNRGGVAYRTFGKKFSLDLAMHYQEESLGGANDYISDNVFTHKPYTAVLPSAVFNYKISKRSNLTFNYQTSTSLPSVFQLQNIINNANPLLLSTGNPALQQSYTQNISLRYGLPVSETGNISFNASASNTMHTVASSVITATKDSTLPGGFVLHQGSQLTMPVNLNGAANARLFASYATPIKKIESNFSLNAGISYVTSPGLINNIEGFTNTWSYNSSLALSGYTKSGFNYSINYSPAYSVVKNTLVPLGDNNYLTENITSRVGWKIWKGVVFNTDLNYRIYSGLNTAYNQNYALWNASIGKKFFKKQNGEFRFYVYDILNSQNSLSHTVTDLYVQNRQANVLGRYYMVSFVYQLRRYKKAE